MAAGGGVRVQKVAAVEGFLDGLSYGSGPTGLDNLGVQALDAAASGEVVQERVPEPVLAEIVVPHLVVVGCHDTAVRLVLGRAHLEARDPQHTAPRGGEECIALESVSDATRHCHKGPFVD